MSYAHVGNFLSRHSHLALEDPVDEDCVADHDRHAEERDDQHHAERAQGR